MERQRAPAPSTRLHHFVAIAKAPFAREFVCLPEDLVRKCKRFAEGVCSFATGEDKIKSVRSCVSLTCFPPIMNKAQPSPESNL